jgi:hypothetical protein
LLFYMGVQLRISHYGKNIGQGLSRMVCWGLYSELEIKIVAIHAMKADGGV